MPEQERTWTVLLSDIDRIKVRVVRDGAFVKVFSAQYEALIYGRWRRITRCDNAHGSEAHRHVYYPSKLEYRQLMNTTDPNEAFTEALVLIKRNFESMKENYILLINRMAKDIS